MPFTQQQANKISEAVLSEIVRICKYDKEGQFEKVEEQLRMIKLVASNMEKKKKKKSKKRKLVNDNVQEEQPTADDASSASTSSEVAQK